MLNSYNIKSYNLTISKNITACEQA
jgi:hypothetical protein